MAQTAGLRPLLARWQSQLPRVPAGAPLARHPADGIRLTCPGEPGWPPQMDDPGAARPYEMWVRGIADLRASCEISLAVVMMPHWTARRYPATPCTGHHPVATPLRGEAG